MRRARRLSSTEARVARVILIFTTACHANSHKTCCGSAVSSGVLFRCVCKCHASDQLDLGFSMASGEVSASYLGNPHVR
jgi:hypothetical protein